MLRNRLVVIGTLFVAVFALGQLPASATVVSIDSTDLHGGQSTIWEADTAATDWCPNTQTGYAPVADGQTSDGSDGFDGGLIFGVNGTDFDVASGMGDQSGQQLTVGPTLIDSVNVTRYDRALTTSPTLRSLIRLTNTTGSSVTRTISLHSDLGADINTDIVATSSGDMSFTTADRWLVTDGDPGDPPVTHVFYGTHASVKTGTVTSIPGVTLPYKDCVGIDMTVKIPANSSRYVLFFAQMHKLTDHAAGYTASKTDVKAFNPRGLSNALLTGISNKIKNRILNWSL